MPLCARRQGCHRTRGRVPPCRATASRAPKPQPRGRGPCRRDSSSDDSPERNPTPPTASCSGASSTPGTSLNIPKLDNRLPTIRHYGRGRVKPQPHVITVMPQPHGPSTLGQGQVGDHEKHAIQPAPADQGVLKVEKVDFKVVENCKQHHTNEYDICEDPKNPQLVVRRGQQFFIEITFNKPYDVKDDDLRLVFSIGEDPTPTKGTEVVFVLSDKDEENQWGAKIQQQQGNNLLLVIYTPPDCIVGKWNFHVDVVKTKDTKTSIFRYNHDKPIYILFNPWCKADVVFMENDRERQAYVLDDKGKLFVGTFDSVHVKPWVFGQFTGKVLDICMYILDLSELKLPVRGNPIPVVRKLTAMANSLDEGGVLVGSWEGTYKGGKPPQAWTGSVPILEEYFTHKGSVKFGQCWVFSAVLTTVLRALGIPARCVTNFKSAHDSDGSITLDYHFDSKGSPIVEKDTDSVWNFHVWNEVWMARPDLKAGYGGWQACDATPQEASDNVYCCGPFPVRAIKEGDVNMPYDGPFIFAEVNADSVYWQQKPDGTFTCVHKQLNSVGKLIVTSGLRGERLDITKEYKFPENSNEERVAVKRANQVSSNRKDIYTEKAKDVVIELKGDPGTLFIGDDLVVTVVCHNKSGEVRTIKGVLKIRTMYYTGVVADEVGFEDINDKLKPGENKTIVVKVSSKDYEKGLKDGGHVSVTLMIQVIETEQVFVDVKEMRLRKPHLDIKTASSAVKSKTHEAPESARVGEELAVQFSFTNPLNRTLTDCYLEVEGPGLLKATKYPQPDLHAKGTFMTTLKFKPQKSGKKEIVAVFNSSFLEDVNGSHEITVA